MPAKVKGEGVVGIVVLICEEGHVITSHCDTPPVPVSVLYGTNSLRGV